MSGFTLTVNLKLSDEQLDVIVEKYGLEDREELIEHLEDFQLELSDANNLEHVLENLDYFNC